MAGSCWYFLRFLDPLNDNEFANKDIIKYWMPVDLYIGGAEHLFYIYFMQDFGIKFYLI